jgi:hypothetical protein
VVSFPQVFPLNPYNCLSCPPHMPRGHRSYCSSLCSILHCCYLVPLRPKYLPQPTFSLNVTNHISHPYEIDRQNYYSVHLNLYIFGYQTGRQKTLYQMIASIAWVQCALNFFQSGILNFLIFDMFYTFKQFITYLYVVILSFILILRHKHILT